MLICIYYNNTVDYVAFIRGEVISRSKSEEEIVYADIGKLYREGSLKLYNMSTCCKDSVSYLDRWLLNAGCSTQAVK